MVAAPIPGARLLEGAVALPSAVTGPAALLLPSVGLLARAVLRPLRDAGLLLLRALLLLSLLGWLSCGIFPLAIVGFGLATWWKRR